ncbi:hypothetical protein RUM43_007336 [Polyplax serrata]|uniref:Uncharacterized protein n=1 Tax=Polyplax serrata TaxID=468196 RepID=A0AAN8PMI6_POLSC
MKNKKTSEFYGSRVSTPAFIYPSLLMLQLTFYRGTQSPSCELPQIYLKITEIQWIRTGVVDREHWEQLREYTACLPFTSGSLS